MSVLHISRRLLVPIAALAIACAPPPGEGIEVPPSARAGCPVDLAGDPYTPLDVDPYLGLVPKQGDRCPEGAEPHPGMGCADVVGPCACRLVCAPGCGDDEICLDDGAGPACVCHPAYATAVSGCVYRGVVANAAFDDDTDWCLMAGGANDPTAGAAEISNGALHLFATAICATAAAETTARLPAASTMPGGAALLIRYRAVANGQTDGQPPAINVYLDGQFFPLPSRADTGELRVCVDLRQYARLATIAFVLEAFGACDQVIDWQLHVEELALVADADCS